MEARVVDGWKGGGRCRERAGDRSSYTKGAAGGLIALGKAASFLVHVRDNVSPYDKALIILSANRKFDLIQNNGSDRRGR